MSIRPEVAGLDIQKFKEMFGSTGEDDANEILSKYENSLVRVDGQKQYFVNQVEDTKLIKDALIGGGTKVDLLEEKYPDILIKLRYLQPEGVPTDTNNWRGGYHIDYFNDLEDKLDPNLSELIKYFIDGRTFFTGGYTTTEFPYAYLTNREVKLILEDMGKDWSKYDDSEGFGKDFQKWLTQISDAGKDLFFSQG